MMRNRFITGLVWGGLIGTALGTIIKSQENRGPKTLVKGAEVVKDTTINMLHKARKARKRVMKTL